MTSGSEAQYSISEQIPQTHRKKFKVCVLYPVEPCSAVPFKSVFVRSSCFFGVEVEVGFFLDCLPIDESTKASHLCKFVIASKVREKCTSLTIDYGIQYSKLRCV